MLLCKYCEQPIYETELSAGFSGVLVHMRGRYRHIQMDAFWCDRAKINPKNPHYEKPRCHICDTENAKHGGGCSACGTPGHRADAPVLPGV